MALNHSAFVSIKGGKLDDYVIVTDTRSIAATCTGHVRFLTFTESTPDAKSCARLQWWQSNLSGILARFDPHYVAIEDYAFGASQGAHQIGEVGGLLRMELWKWGFRWRKYTPGQIKLFAAHKGRAEKEEMVAAVRDRWQQDFSFLRPGSTKLWTSAEDAADAFSAAKLLETEVLLRQGKIDLTDLHEKEIQIFNTVSNSTKTNILNTDWIQRV